MGTFTKSAAEFAQLPVVQEHITKASEMFGRLKASDFQMEMDVRLASNWGLQWSSGEHLEFDSPLEVVFWLWWHAAIRCHSLLRHSVLVHHEFVTVGRHTFNVDFVPRASGVASDAGWPLIAIELDGHEFHERTLEQVTYRNQRDRALQQAGWKIFHFSWLEFTTRSEQSVYEVVEYIQNANTKYYQEQHALKDERDTKISPPIGDDAS